VLESCDYLRRHHGFEVGFVEVDATGSVTPDALAAAIRPDSTLVSIAHANNEVGTVQPIAALASVSHASGIPFHTDAVQSAGWLDLTSLGVDAISLSGHKLGAPKGSGALFVRGRIALEPLMHGGGQERGVRSGTENVAGAVGMAVAVSLIDLSRASQVSAARDAFVADVLARVPSAALTGHPTERLPGTASFVFPGTHGESILLRLEERGVVSSSGSACAAGSDEPSHVLLALGYPAEIAQTAVRFSWGADVSAEQLASAAAAVADAVAVLRDPLRTATQAIRL
jgi:cysteine desulfurase